MTERPSTPDPDALPAPVTGVARGNQGTGTALDDTQVFDVAELNAAPDDVPPLQEPEPVEPPPAPVRRSSAPTQARAARVRRPAEPARTTTSRRSAPIAGLASLAVVAGVVAIAAIAVLGTPKGDLGTGALPTAGAAQTLAPEPTADPGASKDKGKGKGNGNGNGNGNN